MNDLMNKKEMYFEVEFAGQDASFKEIPNGYINKTVCGCGLTTVAIENNKSAVIAMPNIALVTNKVGQYPNNRCNNELFAVIGGVTEDEVKEYATRMRDNNQPIKVLVTYDSLWKCKDLLLDCQLIIDESDRIISTIGMKLNDKEANEKDVNTYMLDLAKQYKDTVSFISATPIPVEYLPEWVSTIPQITMRWANTIKVVPITMERTYPYKALRNEVIKPIQKNGEVLLGDRMISKVIVFINSVEQILKVIKECGISKEDTAILCSDSTRNDLKIRGYNRLERFDNLPRYTFVTSSGFQGIDLVDKEAISVVVSNTTKEYQMVNMLTDLKQAISRQRVKTNPNYNRFIYIFNQNNFDLTEEEVLNTINRTEQMVEDGCSILNELYEAKDRRYASQVQVSSESETFSRYALFNQGWTINKLAFNADRYFILETRKQYTKGFDITSTLGNGAIAVEQKIEFKDESYKTLYTKFKAQLAGETVEFSESEMNSDNYDILAKCIKCYNKVYANPMYAKEMIACVGDEFGQLKAKVRCSFTNNKDYTLKEVKEILKGIYAEMGMKRTAKAKDLNDLVTDVRFKKVKGVRMAEIIVK